MPSESAPSIESSPFAPAPSAGGRYEALLVAGIVLLGLALRGLRPDAMAVEHFDEGVYASNLQCGHLDPPFAYPMRRLYAPPLFPAVLEWAQILVGPPAVMWVNVLLGSLMVLAVWWATHCWFGRSAAFAAALLAATSEYHIAFSRMALTDVPLGLFMLLGVFAGWRAIQNGRPVWIAAAGLLAGLAWCTKYNGWLTLAVTGSGTLAWLVVPLLFPRLGSRTRGRKQAAGKSGAQQDADFKSEISNSSITAILVRWGLSAAVAGMMFWAFVLRDLAPVGGYAEVSKNHAGYFVGVGGWWPGLVRQAGAHDLLMGWPTCIGIAAAWLVCAWRQSGSRGGSGSTAQRVVVAVIGIALLLAAQMLTASGLLAVSAIAGLVCILRRKVNGDKREIGGDPAATSLAAWMLCAWFCGLLIATPLYFPYPRLSLPWLIACWPLAGAVIAAGARRCLAVGVSRGQPELSGVGAGTPRTEPTPNPVPRLLFTAITAVLLGAPLLLVDTGQAQRGIVDWPRAWQSGSMIQYIGGTTPKVIVSQLPDDAGAKERDVAAVVYIAGDPALFYQLAVAAPASGIVLQPIAESSGLRAAAGTPTFLISRSAENAPELDAPNLQLIGGRAFRPSDMVLLDERPASDLRNRENVPRDEIRLYVVQ